MFETGSILRIAKQIVRGMSKYILGSRVMVTSRSKEVLQCLLRPMEVLYMPSITQEQAVEALLYYSHASSFPHVVSREDLRNLAQSCVYKEQCHPLLLKAVGDRLNQVGHHMNDGKDWNEFISQLQAFRNADGGDGVKESVLKVLEKSFLAIPTQLQKIFIELVTSNPTFCPYNCASLSKWLSMVHDRSPKTMEIELAKLQYHGLLEEGEFGTIYVHDLHKVLLKNT